MKKNEPSEAAVASYELTATKSENEISDHEMNEMLSESEYGAEKKMRDRYSLVVFRFFLSHFFWIFACAMVFALCIYCSNLFFESLDKKTLGVMQTGTLDTTSIETLEQLTIYEKMNLLYYGANITDLNYDYTDKYSYNEIHNVFVTEITDFFQCMDLPFSVNGVYEMYIYKYLFTDNKDSTRNFTGWYTHIEYYGYTLLCILDYDTQKILALYVSTDESENNYHPTQADVESLPDYGSYIEPLLTWQEDTYYVYHNNFSLESSESDILAQASVYTSLLRTYYDDDSIYYYFYGHDGSGTSFQTIEPESTNLYFQNFEVPMLTQDSQNCGYDYYGFVSEDAFDRNSLMFIDKFSFCFSFNLGDNFSL